MSCGKVTQNVRKGSKRFEMVSWFILNWNLKWNNRHQINFQFKFETAHFFFKSTQTVKQVFEIRLLLPRCEWSCIGNHDCFIHPDSYLPHIHTFARINSHKLTFTSASTSTSTLIRHWIFYFHRLHWISIPNVHYTHYHETETICSNRLYDCNTEQVWTRRQQQW